MPASAAMAGSPRGHWAQRVHLAPQRVEQLAHVFGCPDGQNDLPLRLIQSETIRPFKVLFF